VRALPPLGARRSSSSNASARAARLAAAAASSSTTHKQQQQQQRKAGGGSLRPWALPLAAAGLALHVARAAAKHVSSGCGPNRAVDWVVVHAAHRGEADAAMCVLLQVSTAPREAGRQGRALGTARVVTSLVSSHLLSPCFFERSFRFASFKHKRADTNAPFSRPPPALRCQHPRVQLPKRISGGGASPPAFPGGRKPALVWFRNDLRLHDHEPLSAAVGASTSVLPVYIFDPREYGKVGVLACVRGGSRLCWPDF
jgi:hypothetical protein